MLYPSPFGKGGLFLPVENINVEEKRAVPSETEATHLSNQSYLAIFSTYEQLIWLLIPNPFHIAKENY